jgi:lipid II:glycine glycyltransferase (peptidoglycan interpeptide bridge formation enzyme)
MPPISPAQAILETFSFGQQRIEARLSSDLDDPSWDEFLQSSPFGQFQQSGAWAKYKATQGWSVARVVLTGDDSIMGGFQILWKETRFGKIAYVSKGPALREDVDGLSAPAVTLLQNVAADYGFRAIILQPPDDGSASLLEALQKAGFLATPFLGVIDSTLLIDLAGEEADVIGRSRPSTRNKYNRAIRRGLKIVDGDEHSIPDFFRLMKATCDRQGVAPNPPDEVALASLWRSMAGQNLLRLKFSCYEGELISGNLFVCFGRRMSIFKTGWAGLNRELHPNNFVICEALKWAQANDFATADFVGLERGLADTLTMGQKISEAQNGSRDAFKLGFGGRAKLLPSATLWIPNPVLRQCLRSAASFPYIERKLRRIF